MKKILCLVALAGLMLGGTVQVGGCPTEDVVTVTLFNDTGLPVAAILVYDFDPDISLDDLLDFGNALEFTVPADDAEAVDLLCDDAGAIALDVAELLVDGVGPQVGTDVLRLGDHFFCGDFIDLIFTTNIGQTELDVEIEVIPPELIVQ